MPYLKCTESGHHWNRLCRLRAQIRTVTHFVPCMQLEIDFRSEDCVFVLVSVWSISLNILLIALSGSSLLHILHHMPNVLKHDIGGSFFGRLTRHETYADARFLLETSTSQ